MKHLLSLLLCAALLLTVGGCTKADDSSTSSSVSSSGSSTASTSSGSSGAIVQPGGVIPGITADNYPIVDGSTANIPLLAALYSAVCDVPRDEAESLVFVSGGTGAVWRNMLYGNVDLLLVYEAPDSLQPEIDDMSLEIDPIGRDGLVFLVNASNPVDSLTREQLIGIYTGEITDWSQVGGNAGPIAAFQRNYESGSQTLFLKLLMGDIEPMDPPSELRPSGMGELIDAVATFDGSGGAIGFSVYYYANLMYTNPDLKLIRVDDVEPSPETIGGKSYPLTNDFFTVIHKNTPQDDSARLIRDWLHTDAGRELLVSENYVPAQ